MKILFLLITVSYLLVSCGSNKNSTTSGTDPKSNSTVEQTQKNNSSIGEDHIISPDLAKAEELGILDKNRGSQEEPFWMSTFAVTLPKGAWEPAGDLYACKPINMDTDKYILTNDKGETVLWPSSNDGSPGHLTFGRSSSEIIGETCHTDAVVMGSFNKMTENLIVKNNKYEAPITLVELFQGEGANTNAEIVLEAIR